MDEHRRHKAKVIVIVGHDQIIVQLLKEVLTTEAGYRVAAVSNTAQALDVVRRVKTDLVLVDLKLPGIDDSDLHEALCLEQAAPDVPVAFIGTSERPPEPVQRNIGSSKYLPKPFDLDEMVSFVAKAAQPY